MKKIQLTAVILIIFLVFLVQYKEKSNYKIIENPFKEIPFYKEEYNHRYQDYYNKTNYSYKKTVLYVNIGLDNPFYSNILDSTNLNTNYILVNKYNKLNKDYIPNNLVSLKEYANSSLKLNSEAYEAFKLMARDAYTNKLQIRIISAYRSYDYQNKLYNNYLKKDSKENVDTYSARPGHSEHHTGLAIDIDNLDTNYNSFENTKEFVWVKNNCYKYGFILRYPKNKEYITGYMYEPWHYRYVGTKISTYIYENNITFEEYYYEFIEKKG